MTFFIRYFCLVAISVTSFSLFSQGQWKLWSNGNLSISTPAELQCGTKIHEKGDEDGLSFTITNCVYQVNEADAKAKALPNGAIFLVNVMEYPSEYIHKDSFDLISDILLSSVPNTIAGHEVTIQYQSEIKYGSNLGLSYRLNYDNGKMSSKSKTFFIDNKLISIQVFTAKGHMLHNSIDKFIDSFHYAHTK
jgi:hypothetical protein